MFNGSSGVNLVATSNAVHAKFSVIVFFCISSGIDNSISRSIYYSIQLGVSFIQLVKDPANLVLLSPNGLQGLPVVLLSDTGCEGPFLYPLRKHLVNSIRGQFHATFVRAVLAPYSTLFCTRWTVTVPGNVQMLRPLVA